MASVEWLQRFSLWPYLMTGFLSLVDRGHVNTLTRKTFPSRIFHTIGLIQAYIFVLCTEYLGYREAIF